MSDSIAVRSDIAPRGWRESVLLRNGEPVVVRLVTLEDEPAVRAFLEELSPLSRQLRFFSGAADLRAAARWATAADGVDHVGLLAEAAGGHLVGHAACVKLYGARAEVAVEVADDHHHLGLATLLLIRLAYIGEQLGIRHFVAEVLPQNNDMLAVFHDGFEAVSQFDNGEADIEFPTAAWRLAAERFKAHAEPGTRVAGL